MNNKMINMMNNKIKIGLICLSILTSCNQNQKQQTSKTECGKILDSQYMSTSFNESQKTQIKAEKCVVVIKGIPSVELGMNSYLYKFNDGSCTFYWDGSSYQKCFDE